MTMPRAAALVCVLTYWVCNLGAAPPDPVITIRNGTVSIPSFGARPRVVAGGPGIDLSGLFDDAAFQAENCQPCLRGSAISVSASLSGTALGPQYVIASNFTFSGDSLQVPADAPPDVTLTAPFTFEGQVKLAQVREPRPEDTTFSATLAGSGTVTVHLSSTMDPENGQRLYFFRDLTYEFTPGPVR